jgi:folate-binding protein YgfZ
MEAAGTQTALDTPLAAIHREAGANMGVWLGCTLPNDFGDWRKEYSFTQNTVALIDKNYRAYISFTGPDRVRYLNAILTNNVKDLQPGQGIVSLLLNPQGRILAEIETHAQPEELFCVSYAMIRERLIETLDKYIIMDDVTLRDDTQLYGTLALEGPKAAQVVAELTGIDLRPIPELWRQEARLRDIACFVTKRSPRQFPSAEFLILRDHLEAAWQILLEKAQAAGGGPMGYDALNALRLEQGNPWFGYDFGDKQIPHEAGLQDTHISYTKGCYTGQEIVERVRSRGQVNRVRASLVFTGTEVPGAGAPLTVDGKEVGHVTRAAFSPSLSAPIAMAYIRRENASPGTELQWQGGAAKVRF